MNVIKFPKKFNYREASPFSMRREAYRLLRLEITENFKNLIVVLSEVVDKTDGIIQRKREYILAVSCLEVSRALLLQIENLPPYADITTSFQSSTILLEEVINTLDKVSKY
jgi:hypothetical protein